MFTKIVGKEQLNKPICADYPLSGERV